MRLDSQRELKVVKEKRGGWLLGGRGGSNYRRDPENPREIGVRGSVRHSYAPQG